MKSNNRLLKKYLKVLKQFHNTKIQIGAIGEHDKSTLSNAELLLIHEFGARKKSIPARAGARKKSIPARAPIRKTFRNKQNLDIIRNNFIGLMNAQIAATGAPNYKKTIIGVGETLKTLVQKTIKKRIGPPNELATLKRKKGNLPLIDTEQMINSIDYGVSKI